MIASTTAAVMRQQPQRIEQFEMEEGQRRQRLMEGSVWHSLFTQLDVDRDGRIPTTELVNRLQANSDKFGLKGVEMRDMVRWADKNRDNWINFPEFCILMAEIKKMRTKYAMLRAAQMVVPEAQRDEKFSYIEKYSCLPPPIFMILISLIEIGFYIYYVVTDEKNPGQVSVSGPVPINSWAIFDPERHYEAWRYMSYMLIHIGVYHITFNCLTQLVLGVPLELVHNGLRVFAVYFAGVLAGSLCVAVVEPSVYLAGASGGVYALIAAHVSNLVVNWSEMEFAPCRLVFLTLLIGSDVGIALYNRFADPAAAEGNKVSYVAHIAGFFAGLLMGIVVLRNFKMHNWEKVVWWIALIGMIIIFIGLIVWNVMLEVA